MVAGSENRHSLKLNIRNSMNIVGCSSLHHDRFGGRAGHGSGKEHANPAKMPNLKDYSASAAARHIHGGIYLLSFCIRGQGLHRPSPGIRAGTHSTADEGLMIAKEKVGLHKPLPFDLYGCARFKAKRGP